MGEVVNDIIGGVMLMEQEGVSPSMLRASPDIVTDLRLNGHLGPLGSITVCGYKLSVYNCLEMERNTWILANK